MKRPYTVADLLKDLEEFDPNAIIEALDYCDGIENDDGSEDLFYIKNPIPIDGKYDWCIVTFNDKGE